MTKYLKNFIIKFKDWFKTKRGRTIMKKLVLSFVFLSLILFSTQNLGESYFLAIYIRTWPLGDADFEISKGVYWNADLLKLEGVDELIIAFGLIRNGSEVYIPDVEAGFNLWGEIQKLKNRYKDLKITLSVGGWGAEGFSDMAYYVELRNDFVKNVVEIIDKYDLDGIDIDWEYPVGPDWGLPIKTRPEDRENYVNLLSELRKALDDLSKRRNKIYKLSVAVPASPWFLQKNDVIKVSEIVDNLKVMCYDYYGGWSSTTGHHANLYNNPKDPAWGGWSTDQAISIYLNAGIPSEKILLGVPFYGRAWKGVTNSDNGLFQRYREAINEGLSWNRIKGLISSGKFVRYWDDVAKAPYLFDGETFISYSDKEALGYIVKYVKEKKLGGVFVWEYAHDLEGDLLRYLSSLLK